jgi:hypothetical protein
VRDKIERYSLYDTIDPEHFYPTIKAAIRAFREEASGEPLSAGQAGTRDGETDDSRGQR